MHSRPRKNLPHDRPVWVSEADPIFLTLCGQPRLHNQFARRDAWAAVRKSVEELESLGRCRMLLLVAMPDHLHLIVLVPKTYGIRSLMVDFKRSVSIKHPIDWQRDGFDHRLRNRAELRAKWNYVRMNPVRAGLCSVPDAWPFVMGPGPASRSPDGERR